MELAHLCLDLDLGKVALVCVEEMKTCPVKVNQAAYVLFFFFFLMKNYLAQTCISTALDRDEIIHLESLLFNFY